MFLRYAFRKENGKIVLYLYKTTQFEFAKELTPTVEDKEKTLEEEAITYIQKKDLPMSFDKIYILIDGNIVKTIQKDEIQLEEKKIQKEKWDETLFLITIKEKDTTQKISLFKYLIGTLFASTSAFSLQKEALKALTVLYRTYALEQMNENGYIEAKNAFVIYRDPLLYKFTYLEKFHEVYNLFREVTLETQGLYLLSDGHPIKPYVHLISSGYTKNSPDEKYLVAKESLWDMKAKNYLQQFFFPYHVLSKKLHLKEDEPKKIQTNKEDTIQFGQNQFSKKELSYLLGLPSFNFICIEEKNGITFLSKGVGNDLGLSIYGANYLAEQGFTYSQILSYYFQNILLYKL